MKIIFKKSFEKQLQNLWIKIKDKFKDRLGIYLLNKYSQELNYHKLKWELNQFYSINITWDIRAIFKEEDDTIIIFYMIWTHSELYK